MGLTSRRGLKIPMKKAKADTRRTFFRISFTGMSPSVNNSTGKRERGSRPKTSYFGNETTVTMNASVDKSLVLGSSLWMTVSL
jgi:hypothetical protein